MDTQLAIAFVERHGDVVEQARLRYTAHRQHRDESPCCKSDYSSLDATCFHLAQAEQLGLRCRAGQRPRRRVPDPAPAGRRELGSG